MLEQYYGEDWQVVLAESLSLDPETDEEELDPLSDPQLSVAAPAGVAPASSEPAVATPSGAAPRPLGAGVGLENYDLTEGVEADDRHSPDRTSSLAIWPGDVQRSRCVAGRAIRPRRGGVCAVCKKSDARR